MKTEYRSTGQVFYPVYAPKKDMRLELDVKYLHNDEDDFRYPVIMRYLVTIIIIGILLVIAMGIVDGHFNNVRAQIIEQSEEVFDNEIDAILDQQNYLNNIDVVHQIVDGHSVTSFSEYSQQIQYIISPPIEEIHIAELLEEDYIDPVVNANPPQLIEDLTMDELEFIERVVEAEVTGTQYRYDGKFVDEDEMLLAKIRVCQVFLNRVYDQEQFAGINTLYESVSYPGASSTVASGRYLQVEVTDLTKEAVRIAMDPSTEDMTDGALYFLAGGATYNKYGDYLFTDAVGHSFFK